MSNKNKKLGLGIAAVAAAGAGLVYAAQKNSQQKVKKIAKAAPPVDYRNTERGKYEKNSKGIYYTNGNYEAFARPKKPEGVDDKNAYIVGSGLAALATACFLVRDGQMPGSHIHILEAMDVAGGACDGIFDPTRGYVMRGGREMENHFECLWDLFRSIPSIETPGVSVLDEYYWLNKEDPNYSLCRATEKQGKDAHTDGKFNLSQKGCMEIMKLFMTRDEDLYDKTIEDVFDDEVFNSTFWLYWRTMFAFENWHSALEMKLYFQRFIHHIGGLPGLLLTMGNADRTEPLTMIGPRGLERVVNALRVIAPELPFEIRFIEITEPEMRLELNGYCIHAFRVNHNVTCYGYSVEIKRAGKFDVERARAAAIPQKYWSRLQKGEILPGEDGTVYTPEMVLGPARRGIKMTYCTDTRPTESIVAAAEGSDLFICEGMYGEDDKLEKAKGYKHMTFREAAALAKDAGVKEMWLTHYSPSLIRPDEYMDMVRGIFPNAYPGKDGKTMELNFEED